VRQRRLEALANAKNFLESVATDVMTVQSINYLDGLETDIGVVFSRDLRVLF